MQATSFHAGIHLEEADILPPEPRCPLCSFAGFDHQVKIASRSPCISSAFVFDARSCVSRFPNPKSALRGYYRNYYKHSVFKDASDVTFHQPQRFASHLLRTVRRLLPKERVKILDFGGGNGDLALATARQLIEDGTGKYTSCWLITTHVSGD